MPAIQSFFVAIDETEDAGYSILVSSPESADRVTACNDSICEQVLTFSLVGQGNSRKIYRSQIRFVESQFLAITALDGQGQVVAKRLIGVVP